MATRTRETGRARLRPRATLRAPTGARPFGWSSALAATGFALLAFAVDRGATQALDRRARRLIGPRKSKKLTHVAGFATNIAAPHLHPLIAAGLALAIYRRAGRNALAIPLASLGATVIDRGIRYMIHQSRPPKATHHPGLDRFAFPSGHTCAATAIGLAFAAQAAPEMSAHSIRATAAIAALSAVGVAWTRLYLDEHWIDDIVGGWLAGVAVGGSSVTATRMLNRR